MEACENTKIQSSLEIFCNYTTTFGFISYRWARIAPQSKTNLDGLRKNQRNVSIEQSQSPREFELVEEELQSLLLARDFEVITKRNIPKLAFSWTINKI